MGFNNLLENENITIDIPCKDINKIKELEQLNCKDINKVNYWLSLNFLTDIKEYYEINDFFNKNLVKYKIDKDYVNENYGIEFNENIDLDEFININKNKIEDIIKNNLDIAIGIYNTTDLNIKTYGLLNIDGLRKNFLDEFYINTDIIKNAATNKYSVYMFDILKIIPNMKLITLKQYLHILKNNNLFDSYSFTVSLKEINKYNVIVSKELHISEETENSSMEKFLDYKIKHVRNFCSNITLEQYLDILKSHDNNILTYYNHNITLEKLNTSGNPIIKIIPSASNEEYVYFINKLYIKKSALTPYLNLKIICIIMDFHN